MYKIIGGDGKEYGPVSAEQIRQWIAESRLNAQTKAQAEGSTEWKTLSAFPEFADALVAKSAQAPPPPFAAPDTSTLSPDIFARDYDLDIGGCISGGWNLLKNNMGLLVLAVLVYGLIEGAIALLGMIPFIGPLFSLANLFVIGPLLGGIYYVFLKAVRKSPAEVGDVFAGFRTRYWQLFLGNLVPGLLAGLCMIPAVIVAVLTILPFTMHHAHPGPAILVVAALVVLIGLVPMIYLSVSWMFTLPLIIDKGLTFWPAMETSRKMVGKHWWTVFGFLIICGLVNLVGVLACCAGLLFTIPIVFGAMMYAYEQIFSASTAHGA